MKLFSKSKDYNNLLEEILENKTFSSVAKSLLLSMIYKLEISYKDYSQVNVNCLPYDTFFEGILNIIQNYCEHIKIVEPESVQAKLLSENNVDAVTNAKEISILTYPTEIAFLYAVSDIEPKYFFIKKDFLLKDTFQRILVEGYKQNNISILKNFNGWSWDVNARNSKNCITNIIYQNLIMIKGEEFLYNWRTTNIAKKDFLKELKNTIKKLTNDENYYLSLTKLLYLLSNVKEKKNIKQKCEEQNLNQQYEFFKNISTTEYEELVNLQKYFLYYMEKKIEKIETTEEILEMLYNLRYYQNTVFFEGVLIKDYRPIRDKLNDVLKSAVDKACKLGAMKIISMNIDTNFEIIKYILDTRILDLEGIKIYIEFEKEEIFIKVFDKEIFEKQGKIKFDGNKKDIVIRKKKNIKLFN